MRCQVPGPFANQLLLHPQSTKVLFSFLIRFSYERVDYLLLLAAIVSFSRDCLEQGHLFILLTLKFELFLDP